jgi:serine/threonine-protein kinase
MKDDAKGLPTRSMAEDASVEGQVTTAVEERGAVPDFPELSDEVVLQPGDTIGRFVVEERLGAGAMGVVYAAHDPKLERRVAVKLLRARGGEDSASQVYATRLLREARAMARLGHPNVVAVHDVGELGERVFIAMELIDGVTLSAWLKQKPRPWKDILAVFLQAGRGLAAAHAVHIVHGDFKPDNVLVGKDGRVRVGDFGLARRSLRSADAEGGSTLLPTSLGASASREGGIVGTPAYMAPEQLRGARADERSDQFSFCVALYEALYGKRPFDGTTLVAILDSMAAERLSPGVAGSASPRWIRAVLSRGLRAKAEARYPSMGALLSGLEDASSSRRWRWMAAAFSAVAVAAVALGVVRQRNADALACTALAHRMDGVWDAAESAKVHDAFVATPRPYAGDMFGRAARVLDEYAGRWTRDIVDQCQAHHKTPADPMAPLRSECMDQRLRELRAFVEVLSRADATTVDHAVQGAGELPQIEVCDGQDPLSGRRWPSDPALAAQARALFAQMEITEATRRAGRYGEALTLAQRDSADADRLGFAPLVADATLALARLQRKAGEAKASDATFREAVLAAERAGDARITVLAWSEAARWAAYDGDFALAEDRLAHAEALIGHVGDDGVRALVWLAEDHALLEIGKYDDARGFGRKALGLFEKRGDEWSAMEATHTLGIAALWQGRYDEALDELGRVLAWDERMLGPDHPVVSDPLNNLALVSGERGDFETELALLQRAQSIKERAYGPDHPEVATGLSNLAGTYDNLNRFAEALPLAERSLGIQERASAPDALSIAYSLSALCEALIGLGRFSEAIAPAERQVAIRQLHPTDVWLLAEAQSNLGRALLLSKHDVKRGRELLREARDTFVRTGRDASVPEIDKALASAR